MGSISVHSASTNCAPARHGHRTPKNLGALRNLRGRSEASETAPRSDLGAPRLHSLRPRPSFRRRRRRRRRHPDQQIVYSIHVAIARNIIAVKVLHCCTLARMPQTARHLLLSLCNRSQYHCCETVALLHARCETRTPQAARRVRGGAWPNSTHPLSSESVGRSESARRGVVGVYAVVVCGGGV